MDKNFEQGFEKTAKEYGWWEKQKGANRAMRAGDEGVKKYLAKGELIKSRLKHQAGHGAVGAAGGAGIGALIAKGLKKHKGLGAVVGGISGALAGQTSGNISADKKYLKSKGIDSSWGGLKLKYSDEAKKKYLSKKD